MLDHLQLAMLSKQVYYKKEIKLGDWQRVFWSSADGLGVAVYQNNKNEMVIAFRGPDASTLTNLMSNIKTIIPMLWGSKPNTLTSAKQLVEEARNQRGVFIRLCEFIRTQSQNQLYLTGYSLGGVLAGLVGYELLKEKGKTYVVVTFENPGYAQYIEQEDRARYAQDFQARYFTYLTNPNLVNTFNDHLGTIYRVKLKACNNDLWSQGNYYMRRGMECVIDDFLRFMLLACALNALGIVFYGQEIIPLSFFYVLNKLIENSGKFLSVSEFDTHNFLALFVSVLGAVSYRAGMQLIDKMVMGILKKHPLDGIIQELAKVQGKNNIYAIEQWPRSGQYMRHQAQHLLTWLNPQGHSSVLNLPNLDRVDEENILGMPGYKQK
ncbi:MAG: hypothetical protein P4L79_06755 [Legionella sp.]|uniref:hypothetical protein n=1 Tax=Legionella sp. TaxID=459 RepID=UPI002844D220|nr:hypothetical protein [Legionella sp.]